MYNVVRFSSLTYILSLKYLQQGSHNCFIEQVEFDVEMTCGKCVNKIKEALSGVEGWYT